MPPMTPAPSGPICVIVVAYNAATFILDCIASVLASEDADLRIVVVDNASSDSTSAVIRDWAIGVRAHVIPEDMPIALEATEARPEFAELAADAAVPGKRLARLTLVRSDENGGFAAGVNIGLRLAVQDEDVAHFWVLNPDSVASPGAAKAFLSVASANPGYGLISGRACYYDHPETVQIDGGLINRWTGVTSNANVGRPAAEADMPEGDGIDFAFGGNMLASRTFVEGCGDMPEDYFLYYEEVDWSLRRGGLPLLTCRDALIYHRAGASIGSPIFGGRAASPFSLYFKHRARMMFVRRYHPWAWPVAAVYTLAKAAQLALGRDAAGAGAMLRGAFSGKPPLAVAGRLHPSALSRIGHAAQANGA